MNSENDSTSTRENLTAVELIANGSAVISENTEIVNEEIKRNFENAKNGDALMTKTSNFIDKTNAWQMVFFPLSPNGLTLCLYTLTAVKHRYRPIQYT